MLTILSHSPALASASRRAFKAAALTLELSGASLQDCSIGTGGLPPNCIYAPMARLCLMPTTADRPLLLEEAGELARTAQEDVLVVRLNTWPEAPHLVTFDLIKRRHWEIETTAGWLPCTSDGNRRLWLVAQGADTACMSFGSDGLRTCREAPPSGVSGIQEGIRRASQFYRLQIWGGL
jgi:hypothetical protein